MPPIFKVGDLVLVEHLDQQLRAQILMIRTAPYDSKSVRQTLGCDVITETGAYRFYYMPDICRWNKNHILDFFPGAKPAFKEPNQ